MLTKVASGGLDGAKGRVGRGHWFSGSLLLLGPEGQDAPAVPRAGEAVGFCHCAAVLEGWWSGGGWRVQPAIQNLFIFFI